MFRGLPVFGHDEAHLLELGNAMISELEDPATPEGEVDEEETTKPIPAGYTYLGQFIDHDPLHQPDTNPGCRTANSTSPTTSSSNRR
jgi:hypothetical protein